MKLTILFSVTGLLATGLVSTGSDKTASSVAANPAGLEKPVPMCLTQPAEAVSTPVGRMRVSQTTFYRGETVELQFSTPHAAHLAVKTPDGKFFYVVFPSEPGNKLESLIDSEKFTRLRSLKINTGQLKADPYTYGVYENKPVFTRSGTYTFIMGDNLHVDDESELAIVKVEYRHQVRPDKKVKGATSNADVAAGF